MRDLGSLPDPRDHDNLVGSQAQTGKCVLQYLEDGEVPATRTPGDVYVSHVVDVFFHLYQLSDSRDEFINREWHPAVFQDRMVNFDLSVDLQKPAELRGGVVLYHNDLFCLFKII